MLGDVLAFAAALDALGFRPHQALTVIGDNRTRLYVGMIRPQLRCAISLAGVSRRAAG